MMFRFTDFPVEIHELFFNFLFSEKNPGHRAPGERPTRLYPRINNLSSLALVCPVWRSLAQERLYHHGELNAIAEWHFYLTMK